MTEQLEKILKTSDKIRKSYPKNFNPEIALILEKDIDVLKKFKIRGQLSYEKLPIETADSFKIKGEILFCKCKGKDVLVYHGRFHYYDGVDMRDIGHMIYVLRYAGIKKILSVDEVAHLNPRFACGELALIYDHINLMGDNPLIGKNDNELGIRFPDMSNAYNKKLYSKIYKVFQENKMKINESVVIGIIGPQTETDAEARFYREAGADVLGYSVVPENITSVHAGIDFAAIGLISRELVADKMMEDKRSEKQRIKEQAENLKIAEKELERVLRDIILSI